jgi:alanine-alpha-ketoisovalerate/valine-pyruvate aminotransferase
MKVNLFQISVQMSNLTDVREMMKNMIKMLKMKQVCVILVPGRSFQPDFRENWVYKYQYMSIRLTANDQHIEAGIKRLILVFQQACQPYISKNLSVA